MKLTLFQYINELEKALTENGIEIAKTSHRLGFQPDLIFYNKDGEMIAVEVKDAKSYGELPLSTAIHLRNLKELYSNVVLVSLSDISPPLLSSLDSIGVKHLIKPASAKDAGARLANMHLNRAI